MIRIKSTIKKWGSYFILDLKQLKYRYFNLLRLTGTGQIFGEKFCRGAFFLGRKPDRIWKST
jgi:hypothetical protein